ncbi:DNA gyrase inhibitor YacG [Porticoccaceae bacterium]|nr:DNA gyrase inhibitor YacG [Porticoccaceae bacterium]
MKKLTVVQCPTCKTNIEWSGKYPQRPFCSQRCQQIDFGDWASETFSIAGQPVIDPDLMDPDMIDPTQMDPDWSKSDSLGED